MLCQPPHEDVFVKLKKLNEEEYKKAIMKKALDLEFDVSYISLVAMTIALAGIVFVNFDKENIHTELCIVAGVIGFFVLWTFCDMYFKKVKLRNILDEETK